MRSLIILLFAIMIVGCDTPKVECPPVEEVTEVFSYKGEEALTIIKENDLIIGELSIIDELKYGEIVNSSMEIQPKDVNIALKKQTEEVFIFSAAVKDIIDDISVEGELSDCIKKKNTQHNFYDYKFKVSSHEWINYIHLRIVEKENNFFIKFFLFKEYDDQAFSIGRSIGMSFLY